MREEFLRRRSPLFAQSILETSGGQRADIILPTVSDDTFRVFMEWSYMKHPECPPMSFTQALDLAIMAIQNQIPALQHQVSDKLRQNIGGSCWKLNPAEVEIVMSRTAPESWLRRLLNATLCSIRVPTGNDKEQQVRGWMSLIDRYPDLAKMWKQSDLLGWHLKDVRDGGPCRFHDHGQLCPRPAKVVETKCPYLDDELYPPLSLARRRVPRESELSKAVIENNDRGRRDVGLPLSVEGWEVPEAPTGPEEKR